MKRLLPLLLLAAALPAESHWALRSVSGVLRQSPAEADVYAGSVLLGRTRALPHDWDLAHEQSLRLYGGQSLGAWRAEWNLLGRAAESSESRLLPTEKALDGRSRALEGWSPAQSNLRVSGEIDQLNLRWQGSRRSIILGRQSVNLGVGFYFSPLDLFTPFNPLETYRDFRPGVDAVRASWSPGDYSIVEVIGVAGYVSPTGGALPPPPDALSLDGSDGQGSLLGRIQANGGAWSLTLQGGRLRRLADAGAAVQLEAWGSSWTLEGDARTEPVLDPPAGWHAQSFQWTWNAGHSRQWNSWLSTRLEGGAVHNGIGPGHPDEPLPPAWSVDGRLALSAQAQASPLWVLSGTWLRRWASSASEQLLFTAERSLSDESSLTLSLGVPVLWPDAATPPDLYSPYSFSLDLRTTL